MNHYMAVYSLIALLVLAGCAPADEPGKMKVAATFFPLYDFTAKIAGEKAEVYSIVPAGSEPHDYEITPKDIKSLEEARAFVTLGVTFSPFEDELANAISGKVEVIPAGKGVFIEYGSEFSKDPHIWLSPKNAKLMVRNIRDGLKKVDPNNSDYYMKNAAEVENDLDLLDSEFQKGLSNCSKRTILVQHNAFSYLSRDYDFKVISMAGVDPESEPTPQQIKSIADTARENRIKYVFYEGLVDPRVANTIASEVGAKTMELSPLEGAKDKKDDYFSIMRRNLNNLKIAMECKE